LCCTKEEEEEDERKEDDEDVIDGERRKLFHVCSSSNSLVLVCVCVCVGCSLPFFSSTRVGMRIAREKNVPETFGSARARKKKLKRV
jgi:hypothetical protein